MSRNGAGGSRMKIRSVERKLSELAYQPLTSTAGGRLLGGFVSSPDIDDVLELGFAHGTSTAYMAAALHEKGAGHVTTVDRIDAVDRKPNISAVLDHVGLAEWVSPIFAARSYTWELMHLLEDQLVNGEIVPCFDFCFIDGAHTWDADGFAFLLVDKLLRGDRWIAFDDVNWTLGSSATLKDRGWVRDLPEEEQRTAQVRKVVEVLARPLGYQVRMFGNYAFAYKPDRLSQCHLHDLDALFASDQTLLRDIAFGPLRRVAS
jgi:predicted O-methyltransferase YrrM